MTTYYANGDAVSTKNIGTANKNEAWYFLSQVDVLTTPGASGICVIGDSITDGRGSDTDKNNRWTNDLSHRLAQNAGTPNIAVLNQGAGGGNMTKDDTGAGTTGTIGGINRFKRDCIDNPSGVKWAIIFGGINDIMYSGVTDSGLETALSSMAQQAHAAGIKVYGATILPASMSDTQETYRTSVNTWIKGEAVSSGVYDGYIDFDAMCGSGSAISNQCKGADTIHPSAAGYQIMADGIDLSLFED